MQEKDIRPEALISGQKEAYQRDIAKLQQRLAEFVPTPCPACGETEARKVFEKYKCTFVACESCATIYMSPRPTPEIMSSYYQDSENYRYWAKHIFPASESSRKERLYKPWIKRIASACAKRNIKCDRLLEVGPGFGGFAQTAKESGIFKEITVIEPTPELADACRTRGLKVIQKRVEDIDPNEVESVSALVCFEVVEHLFAPKRFFTQAKRLLPSGGLLVVSCPNGLGFDIATLGPLSDAVDTEHVNLFNPASLKNILECEGFTDISIVTPGLLDAELVRKSALAGDYVINDPFMKRILLDEWEELGAPFQEFLARNNLSSHMWAFAIKG